MADPSEWFQALPTITRFYWGGSALVTVVANLGLISPMKLILSWDRVLRHLEIWRLVTNFFFYGRFSFNFVMIMYMLVQYSQRLELSSFDGRTADYLTMLIFCGICLLGSSFIFNFAMLSHSLMMCILYVWSQRHPHQVVSFMFGLSFKAAYLPWALVIMNMLLGNSITLLVVGILVGHIYFFLEDINPAKGGRRWIWTPQLFYNWFPVFGVSQGHAPPGRAAAGEQQQPRGAHPWGQGQALGRQ